MVSQITRASLSGSASSTRPWRASITSQQWLRWAIGRPAGGGCAHELGGHASAAIAAAAVEESQHWGRTVELAEPAPEAGARDEAAPLLADEGGVDEERGVVRWEAEEDLLDELLHVHQGRRRHPESLVAAREFRS